MDENVVYSQMIKICGVELKEVKEAIAKHVKKQEGVNVTINPVIGEVHVQLSAPGADEKDGKKLVKPIIRELKENFGKDIYATEEEKTLEEAVVELLKAQDLSLSSAESCTGGMVAASIINVAGASDVFREGFVTYTDKAKRKRLMVKKGTLKTETAVSAKVAKEMAKGGCYASGSDVCVSTTGYAGPEGGTKDKPVGTVFIGCCVKGDVTVKEYHFQGNRMEVRQQAAAYALILLRDCILGK